MYFINHSVLVIIIDALILKGCQSSIVVSSSGGITTNKKLHNHEINREKGNYR